MNALPVCIGALLQKELFLKYGTFISALENLEAEHKTLVQVIHQYYVEYPTQTTISPNELQVFFNNLYPSIKKKEIYDALIIECCKHATVNKDLLVDSLNKATDFSFSTNVIKNLLDFIEGKSQKGIELITPLVEEYRSVACKITQDPVELLSNQSYHEIVTDIERDGLRWSLKSLNDIIGPVYPGTLGHLLARPEVGKTAFGVAQMAFFAYQLRGTETNLIYFGNEESVARTKARFYTSLLGEPKEILLQWPSEDVERVFAQKGGGNVRFIDNAKNLSIINRGIDVYKPLVVMIDQGPKVRIEGRESTVEKRQMVYEEFRGLAVNKRCIIFTLGQADHAAHDKKWVSYDHIDQSKVGIPGEADYIIGMGYDPKTLDIGYRHFYVSKNKLGAIPGKFSAKLNAPLSRYEGL